MKNWLKLRCCGALMIVVLGATSVQAQQLDPLDLVAAYTTADPNNPQQFGIAMPSGRFAAVAMSGCDWLNPQLNINVYPNADIPPYLAVSAADEIEPSCTVHIQGRMSNVPCFVNDNGVCDVALESE